ncbi:MAG: hypothetical protein K2O91_12255 [Lachnospiraceae bacterium]|nr:hypothetical protein [Lachnospiraceae bacterium]
MSSLTKAKADGIAALEQAVINDTPAEVEKLYQKLGRGVFTAHILGIAGRFRGLDMVKVLVENGASFHQDMDAVRTLFPQIFENEFATYLPDFFLLFLVKDINRTGEYILKGYIEKLADRKGDPLKPVCEEELIQIVEYLCDNAEKVSFRPGDYLYFAILTDDKNMTAALKGKGVTISDEKQKMLTEGGGGSAWFAYCSLIEHLRDENFIRVMSTLISELDRKQSTSDSLEASKDKKLHYTDWLCHVNHNRFFSPEYLGFFLIHFNQSKMNKKRLMQEMIFYENVACLEIVAQYGWLKLPRRRDEMIEYAIQNGKTESTAWLLDYKNRTADLAAETKKAEKKLMRELNKRLAKQNSADEID